MASMMEQRAYGNVVDKVVRRECKKLKRGRLLNEEQKKEDGWSQRSGGEGGRIRYLYREAKAITLGRTIVRWGRQMRSEVEIQDREAEETVSSKQI
jgi:hypothetical protein